MYLRVHLSGKERVVAACDAALVGKVLREGKVVLDLKAHAEFYKGKSASEEEVGKELRIATSANLVGERAVGVAKKMGLISGNEVQKVQGVPHVQIYRVSAGKAIPHIRNAEGYIL